MSGSTAEDPTALPRSAFPEETCLKRGFAPVGEGRLPAPIKLYYEIHGDPSPSAEKLVFIMGLNNSLWGWEHQVAHFANKPGYQVLCFDNRGVGNSDSPPGRYKTSEMARDTVDLLDHLGWTNERGVNVIGVSMGGMIGQEVALAIPSRLSSLTLVSTKPGGTLDLPSLPVLTMITRLMVGHLKPQNALPVVSDLLYPLDWLNETDASGQTNRDRTLAEMQRRFDIGKRQTKEGARGQAAAVWTHRVSREGLRRIGEGVPRVGVVTGTADNYVFHGRSLKLAEGIPGSVLKVAENGGHALMVQVKDDFNAFVEQIVREGRERSDAEAR